MAAIEPVRIIRRGLEGGRGGDIFFFSFPFIKDGMEVEGLKVGGLSGLGYARMFFYLFFILFLLSDELKKIN
jgi:hypothetical protein